MVITIFVSVVLSVLTVAVHTPRQVKRVLSTSDDMRLLQSNIQSLSTSLPLLRQTVDRLNIDVILLQEIWHRADGSVNIRNFTSPITNTRKGREGGGVAIITHKRVKKVHLKEFDVDGLEAIWAEISVGKIRTVIGSVYIPPGDSSALDLLGSVIDHILQTHRSLVICMDANSRSVLWDSSCIGINQSRKSMQMGLKLESIMNKHNLQIHNNGLSTYRSGDIATAPDVTLSLGLTRYGNITWSILDDDLRSPHDGIMLEIGSSVSGVRKEVIDWRIFDWSAYKDLSCTALTDLLQKWSYDEEKDVDEMAKELSTKLHECVAQVAIKKIVTEYSRPWINYEISSQLKHLRKLRRKYRLRRSPRNKAELLKAQEETIEVINKAESEWWLAECSKLTNVSHERHCVDSCAI